MTLNADVGSASANSMVTLEEALAIITVSFPNDLAEWESLDPSVQEAMLINGAAFFSYLPLRGEKVHVLVEDDPTSWEQAMPFPRTVQSDTTIIPSEIKQAQTEIAFNIVYRTYRSQLSVSLGASTTAQVKKLGLGGLLSIEFSPKSDESGSIMEQFTRGVNSLTWLKLVKYITQIRGVVI